MGALREALLFADPAAVCVAEGVRVPPPLTTPLMLAAQFSPVCVDLSVDLWFCVPVSCLSNCLSMWAVRCRRPALSHALDSPGARAPSRSFEISAEPFARAVPGGRGGSSARAAQPAGVRGVCLYVCAYAGRKVRMFLLIHGPRLTRRPGQVRAAEAGLEARDRLGWTALTHAAFAGCVGNARALLAAGADASALQLWSAEGRTPLIQVREPPASSGLRSAFAGVRTRRPSERCVSAGRAKRGGNFAFPAFGFQRERSGRGG